MPSEQQESAEQQSECEPDQNSRRQYDQHGSHAEIPGDQRHAVSGRTKEHRLAEAHDSGVSPHQIERKREQAEDQDPRGVDRQIVLKHERQQRADREHCDFHDWQQPPSARTISCNGKPQGRRRRFCHQVASTSAPDTTPWICCRCDTLSIPLDRRDRRCVRRSRSYHPWRRPCTSSSCNAACPEPFRPARRGLRRSWHDRARRRRCRGRRLPASLTAASHSLRPR